MNIPEGTRHPFEDPRNNVVVAAMDLVFARGEARALEDEHGPEHPVTIAAERKAELQAKELDRVGAEFMVATKVFGMIEDGLVTLHTEVPR